MDKLLLIMIQASELRIGNYVLWNNEIGNVNQILEKDICFKCGEDCLIDEIEPIPLTEEILLKCGFGKEKNVMPIYTLGAISIYWISDMHENGRLYFNSWCIHKSKPKTLHQLQNLCFALTGEELTIKF